MLRRLVGETAAGAAGCALLSGQPGIGKSHLLQVAMELAREQGVSVAANAAFELDRAVPLVTLAGALQRCVPETTAFAWLDDERESSYMTLRRLTETLEEYASRQSLLVVIDDVQWVDEFSAVAIRHLMSALESSPISWLFARRRIRSPESPGSQMLAHLIKERRLTELTLGGLDDRAVGHLCEQVVGGSVDQTVRALAAGFGGVPLKIEQLLRALRVTNQLMFSSGTATVVGDSLPSSFVMIVARVLDGLSADCRRMARCGSLFARPFSIDTLGRMMNRPPADLIPMVEEATGAGILVDGDGGLTFAHDLVRRAVYATVSPTIAQALHRQAAMVARADSRSPVEVAEHLMQSGPAGTQEAVTMLHAAAKDVAARAPGTAADLILQALEMIGEHEGRRAPLIADAVGLLALAGRLDHAHRLGATAVEAGLDPATRATLLLGLAEAFKQAGRNEISVEYADRSLAIPGVSDEMSAKLYAIRAHALFYVGDLSGADASGRMAGTKGAASGTSGAVVMGLTARSLVAQACGRLGDALDFARSATEEADRVGDGAVNWHPRIWLGNAQTTADLFDEAGRTFERGRGETERLGTRWAVPLWHYYHAALLTARGRLDEAIAEADAGVATAEQMTAYQLALPILGALVRISVTRDELDTAREQLEQLRRLTADGITAAPEDVAWSEAVYLEAAEGPRAAMQTLVDIYDALPRRPVLIAQDPSAAAALVRIALDADDPDRADAVVETARHLAESNPQVRSLAGASAHAEGLRRRDPALARQAVDVLRPSQRPLVLASALEDGAAIVLEHGDDETADKWNREALDITRTHGALRAQARLARRIGDQPEPATGTTCLPQLTEAERRVALLVAQGKRNLEVAAMLFLSRHTIDSHLRKIFAKLDIKSRVDLARIVAEQCRSIT